MHTAHKGRNFGSKVIAVIDHVDHATKKINGRLKDNGVISITVIDVPPTFVWPRPGEYWYVRKENYHWRLETKMDLRNDYKIEDLLPGEARIAARELRNEDGHKWLLPYYGSFYDTTTQTAAASNTPYVVNINTTDISSGVSIVDGSKITIANAGIYNIQFSAQFDNSDAATQDTEIWFRENGSNIANSNSEISIPAKHGVVNGHIIVSWNIFVNAKASYYYQLVWSTSNTTVRIPTLTSASTGPVIPSVIVTVNRVG